jgi:hypothetical protein
VLDATLVTKDGNQELGDRRPKDDGVVDVDRGLHAESAAGRNESRGISVSTVSIVGGSGARRKPPLKRQENLASFCQPATN